MRGKSTVKPAVMYEPLFIHGDRSFQANVELGTENNLTRTTKRLTVAGVGSVLKHTHNIALASLSRSCRMMACRTTNYCPVSP
jgi:hypothetical protein